MSASTACRGDVCTRATYHRALPLQRQHFWSCAEPLCARMRVRAGGFGGSWRGTITTGASRHRETDTRAPVRALHLVMHNMRILPASTPSVRTQRTHRRSKMAPLRVRDLAYTRVGGCVHRETTIWYHIVFPGLSVGKKRGKNVTFDFESRWISAGGTIL